MNLQIDYLRTMAALAETGNFTKTGERLHLSQSAVSMQIKRLELEVGKALFNRGGKTATPTPDGKLLLRHALRIIKEHDEAVLALTRPDLSGVVRFASPEHYTVGVLPRLLAAFSQSHPKVVVEMRCEDSGQIKAAVDRGELDLGICTQISDGGLIIAHDPVVWAARTDFVLPGRKPLPLAVFDIDCVFRAWALEALEKSGLDFRIVYVSHSVSGLLDAVRAGLAIAPIIRSTVPPDLEIPGVEHGLPALPVSNIALHKTRKVKSEIIDCFQEHIIQSFREKMGGI